MDNYENDAVVSQCYAYCCVVAHVIRSKVFVARKKLFHVIASSIRVIRSKLEGDVEGSIHVSLHGLSNKHCIDTCVHMCFKLHMKAGLTEELQRVHCLGNRLPSSLLLIRRTISSDSLV
jgi:hypothetical protein